MEKARATGKRKILKLSEKGEQRGKGLRFRQRNFVDKETEVLGRAGFQEWILDEGEGILNREEREGNR